MAAAGETHFKPGALEGAAEYARTHHSDSLVVLHQGKLVFERYWNGKTADSLFAAHSMTKTLNAIMVGYAIADGIISSVDEPAFHFLAEWDDPAHRAHHDPAAALHGERPEGKL